MTTAVHGMRCVAADDDDVLELCISWEKGVLQLMMMACWRRVDSSLAGDGHAWGLFWQLYGERGRKVGACVPAW